MPALPVVIIYKLPKYDQKVKRKLLKKDMTKNWLATTAIALLIISIITIRFDAGDDAKDLQPSLTPFSPPKTARGPDQYPSDWAWLQRTFPYGTADRTAHLQALQQAQKLRHDLKKSAASRLAGWEFAGPTNIGGRVSALAIHPTNPRIIYAGAATGGVFKSIDAGKTWFPIFDKQAVLPIGDIEIDPSRPQTVYVGTGEANGGHNNFPGGGLYKSTDGGLTWQLVGLEETTTIARVVVDPRDSKRVFAAAIGAYFGPDEHRGIYRSRDGGKSWEKIFFLNDSTGVIDLIVNPQNSDILYAAAWERIRPANAPAHFNGPRSGIYKTTNAGDNWLRLGPETGLPGPETKAGRIGLAICQSQPDHLYALYTNGFDYVGLYRTRNGGTNWEKADPNKKVADGTLGFSWYFGQVRVHPNNPEKVFVLDVALMGSEDGGRTWPIFEGYNRTNASLHVDHHALEFNPLNPQWIINGNDGGINISEDGGYRWNKVAELPVTQFYNIAYDPSHPARLYGGTQDNGTLRTLTGNFTDWRDILGGDGFYVIVDPTDPDVFYAEAQFGELYRFSNGGAKSASATNGIPTRQIEPRNWSTPVVMDPNNSAVLYYGTSRVYKTTDRAESWNPISLKLTDYQPGSILGTISTIAVAPSNSNVIYVGTDDSHVWVTPDGGATWNEISAALPFRWVTRVQVDPFNENIAYATFSGLKWKSPQPHVFRTTDMGQNWTDISSNLPEAPINSIVIDPVHPNVLFVATDVGVFHSENTGQSWASPGEGLPAVSVYDLVIDATNRFLIAGTHGRSMYRIRIDAILGIGDGEAESISDFQLQQNYPNPFNAQTQIDFSIPKDEQMALRIFDVLGREIATLVNAPIKAGNYTVIWDGRDSSGRPVASGIYFYRLQIGKRQLQKRMAVLK
jgi:photosystem II stability/assembly factor-like uncharacterized protein